MRCMCNIAEYTHDLNSGVRSQNEIAHAHKHQLKYVCVAGKLLGPQRKNCLRHVV